MGAVLPFPSGSTGQSAAPDWISSAYTALQEQIPDFRIKPEQVDLSKAISRALISNIPLAAEAPTGIGKTLAYLIGALAARHALQQQGRDMPIVVATGTVALQSQVLSNDLPKLAEAEVFPLQRACVLKGRGRYFCPLAAERLIGDRNVDLQYDMFGADKDTAREFVRAEAIPLLDGFRDGNWSGDFDSWELPVSAEVRVATGTTAETCVGQSCEHIEVCPFKRSRRVGGEAELLVINHDLLMLDLQSRQKADRGEDSFDVLPCEDYLLVIDEAHHLPAKALDLQHAKLDFTMAEALLTRVTGWVAAAFGISEIAARLQDSDVKESALSVDGAREALKALQHATSHLESDDSGAKLFLQSVIPAELTATAINAAMELLALGGLLEKAGKALKSSKIVERIPRLAAIVHGLTASGLGLAAELARAGEASQAAVDVKPAHGYWAVPGASIESSPLEAGEGLRKLLWESGRCRPVAVSATLRDFTSLAHFRKESGFPEEGLELVLPYVFDYPSSCLQVVKLHASPNFQERKAWLQELAHVLPQYVNPKEGTLILFQSREAMMAIKPFMDRALPGGLWQVRGANVQTLKDQHTHRILHEGHGSYLAGVSALAEGLDLPGKLCTHVIVVRAPFHSPSDPLTRLRQHNDPDFWTNHSMPATLRKLLQQVGRLLRRDTDYGTVTIFDDRLVRTLYGRKLLDALPPFRKTVKQPLPLPEPR